MICISHQMTLKTPLYPGTPPITVSPGKSIDKGDSANTSILSLSTHSGTHIDLPRHFCRSTKSVLLTSGENIFAPAYCFDIPKERSDPISVGDFENIRGPPETRAILVRTGFSRFRSSDPDIYTQEHPWILPEAAKYIRKTFPNIALFGTDTVSISSPSHRALGHEAHRIFLCERPPILLLEDLDLSSGNLSHDCWKLTVYPFILDDLDAVPAMVFLEQM